MPGRGAATARVGQPGAVQSGGEGAGREGEPSPRVLGLEPVQQSVLVEGSRGHHVALVELDVGDGVRVHDHLNQPRLVSCGEAAIRGHPAEMKETLPLKSCPQMHGAAFQAFPCLPCLLPFCSAVLFPQNTRQGCWGKRSLQGKQPLHPDSECRTAVGTLLTSGPGPPASTGCPSAGSSAGSACPGADLGSIEEENIILLFKGIQLLH